MGCNTSQEQSTGAGENGDASANAKDVADGNLTTIPDAVAVSNENNQVNEQKEQHQQQNNTTNDKDGKKTPDGGGAKSTPSLAIKSVTKITETPPVENSIITNGHDLSEKDEEEAATKIQAVFRGHKVRATMKQGDQTTTTIVSTTTTTTSTTVNGSKMDQSGGITNTMNTTNNDPSRQELETEFDPNDKDLCSAAVRIQSTFRGHLARKMASGGGVKDEKDLQEITKKVAEELDIDLNDPELNKAATKIQASFRGHKVRKDTTN